MGNIPERGRARGYVLAPDPGVHLEEAQPRADRTRGGRGGRTPPSAIDG